MSDEIVIRPKDVAEGQSLAKTLSLSALIPQALRKKPEDIFAVILAGSELGLAPMQAIRGINIIQGKPSLSADTMGALVQRSPVCEYLTLTESSGKIAIYETKRRGSPGPVKLEFTIEQARAAGLAGDNWRKYPDAMLRARALAAICRAVYPDLCMGLYDSDGGEITEPTPVERDVAPQAEHAEAVKAEIRAQVEVVDAEVVNVTEAAADPVEAMRAAIESTQTLEALQALIGELAKLPTEAKKALRGTYEAKKLSLTQVTQ